MVHWSDAHEASWGKVRPQLHCGYGIKRCSELAMCPNWDIEKLPKFSKKLRGLKVSDNQSVNGLVKELVGLCEWTLVKESVSVNELVKESVSVNELVKESVSVNGL
jgi:hypothetical protein